MAAPSEQPYMRRRRAVVGAPLVGTPACAMDLFGARQHLGAAAGRRDESRRHARGVSGPSGGAQLQHQGPAQPQPQPQRHVHFANGSTPVAPVARSRRGATMVKAALNANRKGGAPAPAGGARQRAPEPQAEPRTALDTVAQLSPLRQQIKVCQAQRTW